MPQVKSFKASYGASAEIQGIWHKFLSEIEVELQPEDNVASVKQTCWNTVKQEVEKQFSELVK